MKTDRRKLDRRMAESHFEGTNRRIGERRRIKRNPWFVWYMTNRKEIQLYLFIMIVCILVALSFNFKDTVSKSLTKEEDVTFLSKSLEAEEDFLREEIERKSELLNDIRKMRRSR
ncbi:MAG: hypothetical protein SCARUB_02409 [Candidatus Scalindua rubra]|uniref:Uncharacterized protein n=1 Tax=Candidatus Scalindua rubra TaxID=1872076 RepID=A0A1E3XA01_9BACT|nr:MAG: hypothetical protein SCARUB_02409 [Candidatus Scalindua rubra]